MTDKKSSFPKTFAWGVAAGGPQSDGVAEGSDWMIRERKGEAPESGQGNGRRTMFDRDMLRLAEAGIKDYKTSVDWSRIEPQKGVYDREAIEQYRAMMEAARRRGINIWITLHHVVLPAWFARMGGFADEAALMYWHRFVELMAKEFGRLAEFWIPVHEPVTYAAGSNLLGIYPPAKRRMDRFAEMVVRILRAHGDAYKILKTYLPPGARVGMSALVVPVSPMDPEHHPDVISSDFIDSMINRPPLEAVRAGVVSMPGKGAADVPSCLGSADFILLGYWFRFLAGRDAAPAECFLERLSGLEGMPGMQAHSSGEEKTEMDAGACPAGVYDSIKRVHGSGLNKPIYISTGIPTRDEALRQRYLFHTLEKVREAISQGLDVQGFLYSSDVDSYEWDKGFDLHYGLWGFDPETFERQKRPAADLFSSAAKSAVLPEAPE